MAENRKKGISSITELQGRDHLDSSLEHHINSFIAKPKNLIRASRGNIDAFLLKTKVALALLVEGLAKATRATPLGATRYEGYFADT